jgi:cytochrome c553
LGSVERGRRLATTGDGRTLACAGCHGPGLRGVGEVPPIAGRSPTYLMRQLVAFRTGARDTPAAGPMRTVVAQLDVDEMIALAAYVGSVQP